MPTVPATLMEYSGGSIVIRTEGGMTQDYVLKDDRVGIYRTEGYRYRDLKKKYPEAEDRVFPAMNSLKLRSDLNLREYQRTSLKRWKDNGNNGIVVLPTAAGKTHIGLAAIEFLKTSTIVIAPTIDLIEQWKKRISETFGIEVGQIGGGEDVLLPVTVCTYDSAYLRAESLGNRFRFLLVDEVHHLSAGKFIEIARMYASPFRLGLTATLERTDGLHETLSQYMGEKVFELGYEELADFLSSYQIVRIPVRLSPGEEREYDRNRIIFLNYARRHRMTMSGSWNFEKFILSSWNPEGREALIAWRRSREIAFSAEKKIEATKEILKRHVSEKTIIFSEDTETAYLLSKTFLIPAITYLTPPKERREYLQWFRENKIRVIATSKVLDEGVDVPDASVAIVLSGSGSTRQFRQRLGRILRPSPGKQAFLYEVVAKGTSEFGTSARRRKGVPVESGTGSQN
ncbi:MAG: DEAD/DEAH box helicase family protein [Candidatus Thermoplasmatota archaeon]|nr:DEAD/DEAH box helicase family protein [Candidatus Thermoplasmatota archaeon]